jgi:hypothetical protein
VFVHGSGSSRHSARNRFVAGVLNGAGLGTLLFDLLTADEELERANVFDIDLLAGRLLFVTRWVAAQTEIHGARIGYFGASTGAAAALWAAAEPVVPISPPPAWTLSRRRPSLSWGVTTTSSSASTARPNPTCGATAVLPSSPVPPTSSRSRAHSKPSPHWRETGLWTTWPGPSSRLPESVRIMMRRRNKPDARSADRTAGRSGSVIGRRVLLV